jgi:hypothetical protein
VLTNHLKSAIERAAALSPSKQEEIATLIEEAPQRMTSSVPSVSPDWSESVERAMREQAETLEYLKDK